MGVKIVTDSTSEISQADAKKLNIEIVPLKNVFSDKEYREGIDLMLDEFYTKLTEAEVLPTTSQPSPYDFEQVYRKIQEAGDDQIITICISEKLSGTCQSARIAAETCGGDIMVIDSETTTLGLHVLIKYAISLRDEGKTAEEIIEIIEREKKNVCIYAAIDTLEYLYKGGRLSRVSAAAGTLLNLKPMITLTDGVLSSVAKCRGLKKAYEELFKFVEASGGIDASKPFSIGYSGNDRENFDPFAELCKERYAGQGAIVGRIGSVVGSHVGPGAVAICYFKK
jgi:DegV family protein with EDD domain